jgi:hypothetical protein
MLKRHEPYVAQASVWLALAGIVIPLMMFLVLMASAINSPWEVVIPLVSFILVESLAFTCGIFARETEGGLWSVCISGLLLLVAFFWGFAILIDENVFRQPQKQKMSVPAPVE